MNNSDNEEDDNSNEQVELISDDEYDEKVKDIKYGIMKVKLLLMKDIIYRHIKYFFFIFTEKMRLKNKMVNLFIKDDNFLYIFPREKIYKFNNHIATKRLTYVIKKYRYRQIFLLQNAFSLWKINTDLISMIFVPKKESLRRQRCLNFISVCHKIITKQESYLSLYRLSFLMWYTKSRKNEILYSKFTRACIILGNIFNQTLSYAFHKFPCNYLYLKQMSEKIQKELQCEGIVKDINANNKEINMEKIVNSSLIQFREEKKSYYILQKKKKLLKIVSKMNLKNCVNRRVYYAFRKMRSITSTVIQNEKENRKLNDMLIDLKCDSLINGSLMLKIILEKNSKCDLLILKRKFYDNLISKVKFMNTLVDYSHKYKKIPGMLQTNKKIELLTIRNQFRKIFGLHKIFLIREHHKYLFCDLNINLKNSYLQGCFYRWKGTICNTVLKKNKKILSLNECVFKLNQILFANIRNSFITRLMLYGNIKVQKDKMYKLSISSFVNQIDLFFIKRKLFVFYDIFYRYSSTAKRLKDKSIALQLMISIYRNKKCVNIKCYHFIKWKSISQILSYEDKILNDYHSSNDLVNNDNEKHFFIVLSKLLTLVRLKQNRIMRSYINQWKFNMKKNYYRSNISIDSMIIQNMSTILLDYENEDNKLKHEISKLKSSLIKNQFLIHIIYSKNYNVLYHYFARWSKNIFSFSNFKDLLAQSEQIKKENDALIPSYYDKKNQYKKTIYDYEYMKKHYCKECMGEEFEIDYKSINNEVFTENRSNNEIDTESDMHIDTDEDMNNLNQINTNTEGNKIADKENLIKEYQNEYNQQLKYYEDYITTMEKKKEELLAMKQMLLEKKKAH